MSQDPIASLFEPYVWQWFQETFGQASPPQVASWPRIASGRNTLICAPTGSGKTLAAFLWSISELYRMGRREELEDTVYVLYLSPLKALNNDIQRNLVEPLSGIQHCAARAGIDVPAVRSAVRTGDTTQRQRAAMVRRPPHILITTPESLYIILTTSKFREALAKVRYVIVDEIHAISDNKRGVHLSLSLERLNHLVRSRAPGGGRPDPVRIGLSATQRPLDEIARFLVGADGMGEPRPCDIVDVGGRKNLDVQVISPVDNLLEAQYDAIWGSCYDALLSMVRTHETTLIFTNSRYKTERTALRLNELSADDPVSVGAHHGSMSKRVRLEMENSLKAGEMDALVATSSLELGIDVGSIDLVCQIRSPKSVSRGMQRIGRAGHLLDATSKGRLLVTDRDDLVESAVLVRAVMDGEIDRTRVPTNCLDVLAQQVVAAVAADTWQVEDLYRLCRRSHCYRDLARADFVRVLDMLSGNYVLDMERPPYPKITWDKVNDTLYPERSARLIAFRAGGTIPDTENYDVYLEKRKTTVGRLDEGFVERLHVGDIFVLGSSSWRVLGFRRNRVIVEDVYGRAPTIPFWGGDRDSRTYDLGLLVGRFRREVQAHIGDEDWEAWLRQTYHLDANGAKALAAYVWEQHASTGVLPSDRQVVIERFRDELGLQQIVIHTVFGIRVNDAWAMALGQAIQEQYGYRVQTATVDDGILVTVPRDVAGELEAPLSLVDSGNVDALLQRALFHSPVFASRFRHNAVRAFMVLREYRGRHTPVWLQNLRASALLEACRSDPTFPLIVETLRECMNEAVDGASLHEVLARLGTGAIEVREVVTRVPSPFTHSLLLLGQYGDTGAIPTRERRTRLLHLHRELLKQILDEETLRNLLDLDVVREVEARLQRTEGRRRAKDANDLARIMAELGDLVDTPDPEISLHDRVAVPLGALLDELVAARRAVQVPLSYLETQPDRWVSTESWPVYRAAFAAPVALDDLDRELLACLHREEGPISPTEIPLEGPIEDRLERLVRGYQVLRLPVDGMAVYVDVATWIPEHILAQDLSRDAARTSLVLSFLRQHGPVTKYEVMERYGLPERWVEAALDRLASDERIVVGEYLPTKALPQWCYRPNLERIHRLTLQRLRKEMEPASPEEYADLSIRWQHLHPATRLSGIDGLRQVVRQLQGNDNYQIVHERDAFPGRVADYRPHMLDRLCYGGEVVWRRFGYRRLRRGQIGFCFRADSPWLAPDPQRIEMDVTAWDDDIPGECNAVRTYLRDHGACFYDDVVADTGLDWRVVLRAVWHLVWTGEATNDSYESIRYADVASGLSGTYDLATKPGRKGVTIDLIVRHMLDNRRLDPRLGRWAPTERLLHAGGAGEGREDDAEVAAARWAAQLLQRYGVLTREALKLEGAAPRWQDLRRALARMELLGQIRRGYFVDGLSGEQYATPDAVEALREAKLRSLAARPEAHSGDTTELVLVNLADPANPFGSLFPLTDQAGNQQKIVRTPTKYLVLHGGRPVIVYEGRIIVLADLSRTLAREAVRLLTGLIDRDGRTDSRRELAIRSWNGHPIDVSPARHLLTTVGFVQVSNRWRGYVYDGTAVVDTATMRAAEEAIPDVFEYAGKEEAPVVYDAAWVVSRADPAIRAKLGELLGWLHEHLPPACEFVYQPRYIGDVQILYRGMRCIDPHIQRRQVRVRIAHTGWTPGIIVTPDTVLDDSDFADAFWARFRQTCAQIDALLEARGRHGADAGAGSAHQGA